MSSSLVLQLSLLFSAVFTAPVFEYDGDSTVQLLGGQGQYNWTLKYYLGVICEGVNWRKTMYIDIHADTKEGDLIFAFGSQDEYVGFGMAYDGILWVPLNNGEQRRGGALFATPAQGAPLQATLTSLEAQYARDFDFRNSLITGTVQTEEWSVLAPCYCDNCNSYDDCRAGIDCPTSQVKANCQATPMATNASQIILEIRGDRHNWRTEILVTKNGATYQLNSNTTWPMWIDIFLYFGVDAIDNEIFTLRKITSVDDCDWTEEPTTYAPTGPTIPPTRYPSVNPTINPTIDPTTVPTEDPTIDPTEDPTDDPTIGPTKATIDPTTDPTMEPTDGPSIEPTAMPSNNPSDNPSAAPSTTSPTALPTKLPNMPSSSPITVTETVTVRGESNADKTILEGDSAIFVWLGIAIALVLLVGLLSFIGFRLYKKRKMEQQVSYNSNWQSH